uniref:Immunoglobulin V-set domain-containing protein n=1 Tax=Monopterus albus TaxID=43700 RepID=A0A3Q3KDY0_MONAL
MSLSKVKRVFAFFTWNITVTRYINAQWGSEVTIPCVFTYPAKHHTENVQVYWKKPGRSNFVTGDKDVNSFVFHPNDTYVLEKYRRKTMLIGNKNNGNCSLRILNVTDNEPELYMRLIGKGEKYSFRKDFVSLFVYGKSFSNTF